MPDVVQHRSEEPTTADSSLAADEMSIQYGAHLDRHIQGLYIIIILYMQTWPVIKTDACTVYYKHSGIVACLAATHIYIMYGRETRCYYGGASTVLYTCWTGQVCQVQAGSCMQEPHRTAAPAQVTAHAMHALMLTFTVFVLTVAGSFCNIALLAAVAVLQYCLCLL